MLGYGIFLFVASLGIGKTLVDTGAGGLISGIVTNCTDVFEDIILGHGAAEQDPVELSDIFGMGAAQFRHGTVGEIGDLAVPAHLLTDGADVVQGLSCGDDSD